MLKISKIEQTCYACPSQWEIDLEDGRHIYVRYRWGTLSFDVDNIEVYSEDIGDGLSGVIGEGEMLRILNEKVK